MREAIRALVVELPDKAIDLLTKLYLWAPPEQPQKKSRQNKKTRPTRNNTLYFQGRFLVPKAILEQIARLMGFHIRVYSKAGIFVSTDQDLVLVDPITEAPITWEDFEAFDDEGLEDPEEVGREL
jgi:hypothetical protein